MNAKVSAGILICCTLIFFGIILQAYFHVFGASNPMSLDQRYKEYHIESTPHTTCCNMSYERKIIAKPVTIERIQPTVEKENGS